MIRRSPARKLARCPILAPAFWRKRGGLQKPAAVFVLCAIALAATACHSYHVDATVENRTGSDIQLLEVDYPSASFGADHIASGAAYHYRFQIRGSGPLEITYTGSDGKQVQIAGPTLVERQQGRLKIVLLPAGKAEFIPQLTPFS